RARLPGFPAFRAGARDHRGAWLRHRERRVFPGNGQLMAAVDLGPVWLSLKLAGLTTLILLLLGTPLAWWLAFTRWRGKAVIQALVSLPLVLPPTVLGFYLLILFSPDNPLGAAWLTLTGDTLSFSFSGLVLASVLYSFPFVVQPLQASFALVGRGPLEAAATL